MFVCVCIHAFTHTHTNTHQRWGLNPSLFLILPVCVSSGGAHDVTVMSRRALTSWMSALSLLQFHSASVALARPPSLSSSVTQVWPHFPAELLSDWTTLSCLKQTGKSAAAPAPLSYPPITGRGDASGRIYFENQDTKQLHSFKVRVRTLETFADVFFDEHLSISLPERMMKVPNGGTSWCSGMPVDP